MHLKGRMCRILVKGVCSQAKTARINSWVKVLVAQLCPTLCDLMDCGLPGSSVHGILQARILRWVVIPFSRGSSRPGDRTCASCTAGGFFNIWATRLAVWPYENELIRERKRTSEEGIKSKVKTNNTLKILHEKNLHKKLRGKLYITNMTHKN